MSVSPPPVVPRKPTGIRVMIPPAEQPPPAGGTIYEQSGKVTSSENGTSGDLNGSSQLNAGREVEILNHCFDDVERFMSRLQQTAEAQSILNLRNKKRSRKSKKQNQNDDLLTVKANPPSEEEFVDLFQKIKYSLCLLDRLMSSISQPDAPELLHHIFVPLRLMVKTTGGTELGASVVSPAMTSGAISFLHEHLTEEEKELWTSLGSNWTSPCLDFSVSDPPYSPVFIDGWQLPAYDSNGHLLEDPVQMQHKQDAVRQNSRTKNPQEHARPRADGHQEGSNEVDGNGLPPEGERLYCCSYDFVARNSSELSVLHGETLEVIDSSKRWWKCRNRFDQIGFVPHNILEPLSALNDTQRGNPVVRRSKKTALIPQTRGFSYAPTSPEVTSPTATSPTVRTQSMVLPSAFMPGENGERVLMMNDELLQRLAEKRGSVHQPVVSSSFETSVPLNYHSPPAEVEAWLTAKDFSEGTIQSLGILTGAQLFSLNKDEFCMVSPEEGARIYSQIMVQKALLEDVCKASELEAALRRQWLKMT